MRASAAGGPDMGSGVLYAALLKSTSKKRRLGFRGLGYSH